MHCTTSTPPANRVVAMPGTLIDPRVFERINLPGGWCWDLVDWMSSTGPWDLPAVSRKLVSRTKRREDEHVVLLGHSSGGASCLLAILSGEAEADGLVLVGTGASARGHGDPDLHNRVRREWSPEFREDYLRTCLASEPSRKLWNQLVDFAASVPLEAMASAAESLRSIDLNDELARITVPTLVIQGRYDQRRGTAHARALVDGIPGARLIELSSGHTPMVDTPDRFSEALSNYLESLELKAKRGATS